MMNVLKKKIGSSKILSALMIGSLPFISACGDNELPEGSLGASLDITSTVVLNEDFSILEQAVIAADLAGTLSSDGPFTVFAPSNDAFQALLDADPDDGLATPADILALPNLADILLYHVVPESVPAADALSIASSDMSLVDTALADNQLALSISSEGGQDALYINTSKVVATDIFATNGVIHEIDKVLLPADPNTDNSAVTIAGIVTALAGDANDPEFTTLRAAVSDPKSAAVLTALSDVDGSYTVFAPTDAAFAALLAAESLTASQLLANAALPQILFQHTLTSEVNSVAAYAANGSDVPTAQNGANVTIDIQGGEVFVEGAKISTFDIVASNGIIHVIDSVIFTTD